MAPLLIGSVVLLQLAAELRLHERAVAAGWAPAGPAWFGGAVLLGGIALVLLPHALAGRLADRRLGAAPAAGLRWLRVHERIGAAAPLALLGVFALALAAGWGEAVRGWIGDAWILDDLATLAPPLSATVLLDASAWPLVRRFREATLLRRADAGLPIHPVPRRWAYALGRLRGGAAVLGVPLLLILGWSEAAEAALASATAREAAGGWLPAAGSGAASIVVAAGSLLAVALAPPLLVRVLPTSPLPGGPLRDELEAFLVLERVKARGLRLWQSGGVLANAALVGVLPRLRYLLLSDGLLDALPRPELLAVLGHEAGHARHRHLLWLGAAALALGAIAGLCLDLLEAHGLLAQPAAEGVALAAAAGLWLAGFGWVSRRVEAQADAHAAASMSVYLLEEQDRSTPRFTPAGVDATSSALARVSRLAGARETRRSYRHGSIASRRAALAGLLEHPRRDAPADRAMRRVKAAVLVSVPLAAALWWAAR